MAIPNATMGGMSDADRPSRAAVWWLWIAIAIVITVMILIALAFHSLVTDFQQLGGGG